MPANRRERFDWHLVPDLTFFVLGISLVFLSNLRVVLMRNRPSLIVILLSWAGIAFIAWAPMDITGNYFAGFRAGCVFVLVILGIWISVGFIVRIIRQVVHL